MEFNIENSEEMQRLIDNIIQRQMNKSKLSLTQLKDLLEDYLRNPYSKDKKAFLLSKKLSELTSKEENFQYIWEQIENFVYSKYSKVSIDSDEMLKKRLREYEKKLITLVVEFGNSKGTYETLSIIIGYLLIRKNLTQSELQKLSGLSRGAISENLTKLVENGYVNRKLIEGTRTYQYSFGNNMKAISENTSFIKLIKGKEIEEFTNEKISELDRIKNQSEDEVKLLKNRLKELKEFSKLYRIIIKEIRDSNLTKRIEEGEK